jgi:outer membrane autotransporter protein
LEGAAFSASNSIVVEDGSSIYLAANHNYTNAITIVGLGWNEGQGRLGALRLGDGANLVGALTLAGDSRIAAITAQTTISGSINDGGNGYQVEKTGNGTLVLAGVNTFSRGIMLSGGILKLSGSGSVVDTTVLSMLENTTFDISGISGSSVVLGALNSTSATSTINIGNKTLEVGSGNYAGSVIGTDGILAKTGTDTFTLTNVDGLNGAGTTRIDEGILALRGIAGYDGTGGTKTVVLNGGWLDLSDTGGFAGNDSSNANSWSGLNLVNNNTGTGGVIGANDVVTISTGTGWAIGTGTSNETGNGVYVVIDAGLGNTVSLADNNTYAGVSRLVSGTLDVSNNSQLGDESLARSVIFESGNLWVSGNVDASNRTMEMRADGTLTVDTGMETTWKTLVLGSDSSLTTTLTKEGSGKLILNDVVSYAGALSLSDGETIFNSSADLGALFVGSVASATFEGNADIVDLTVDDYGSVTIADGKTLTLAGSGNLGMVTVTGGTVVNQGTLTAGDTDFDSDFSNEANASALVNKITGNLVNHGELTINDIVEGVSAVNHGTLTGADIAVHATNANVTVTNNVNGIIGGLDTGILLDNGGTVVNYGAVDNAAVGIDANDVASIYNDTNASISGSDTGISLLMGGTVENHGAISGGSSDGIHVAGASGVITNYGIIQANGDDGVEISNGGTVTNHGTISGAYGVYAPSGGEIVNMAGATISGSITALLLTNGTVSNSGTVTGAVDMPGATASLVNNSGALISGNVSISADVSSATIAIGSVIDGNLGLSGADSTLTLLGDSGTQRYSSSVTGTTSLNGVMVKQGTGTWLLDSDIGMIATRVETGNLAVDWDVTQLNHAPVEIDSGATLTIVTQTSDGIISNELSGAGNLVTQGDLAIDQANLGFTGTATHESGTLTVADSQAFGAFGTLVNSGGATLSVTNGFSGELTNHGTARLGNVYGSGTRLADVAQTGPDAWGKVANDGTLYLLQTQRTFGWGEFVNNGHLDFVNAGSTLYVDSLSGTGTIRMDVDALDSTNSDQLIIRAGGTIAPGTQQQLQMTDVTSDPNSVTAETSFTVVAYADGTPLPDGTVTGQVSIGLYTFDVGTVGHNGQAVVADYSPSGQTAINMIGAISTGWFSQLDNILKRMGDLRLDSSLATGDLWMRAYGQQINADLGIQGVSNFREYQYGGDIGIDEVYELDSMNSVIAGIFGGYQGATRRFRDGAGSSGNSDSVYGGLYATWIHADGWYADGVVKGQYFSNDYDAESDHGDFHNYGLGASIEFGKQWMNYDGWFIEPSVQFAYTHIFADSYNTDQGLRVKAGDSDIYRFAGSIRLGKVMEAGSWGAFQPYAKVGVEEQISDGGSVRIASEKWRPNTDGTRGILGAGVVWLLDERQQVYFDYEGAFGDKYDKPWGINAGYRVKF